VIHGDMLAVLPTLRGEFRALQFCFNRSVAWTTEGDEVAQIVRRYAIAEKPIRADVVNVAPWLLASLARSFVTLAGRAFLLLPVGAAILPGCAEPVRDCGANAVSIAACSGAVFSGASLASGIRNRAGKRCVAANANEGRGRPWAGLNSRILALRGAMLTPAVLRSTGYALERLTARFARQFNLRDGRYIGCRPSNVSRSLTRLRAILSLVGSVWPDLKISPAMPANDLNHREEV
jgi:hypothetical protein